MTLELVALVSTTFERTGQRRFFGVMGRAAAVTWLGAFERAARSSFSTGTTPVAGAVLFALADFAGEGELEESAVAPVAMTQHATQVPSATLTILRKRARR